MSFVGKVLIVVQVVMSLCFMAFAGAVYVTHENWMTKYEDSTKEIASLNQSKADIETNVSKLQDERDSIRAELTAEAEKWKTASQVEERSVRDLTAQVNNVNTDLERQRAIASQSLIEAENREKESELLRKQLIALQNRLDEVSAELNTERDKSFNSEVALRQLEERFTKLQISEALLAKVVRKNGWSTDPTALAAIADPPPKLRGMVEKVEKGKTNRTKYVVISVGQDDGLRIGHELSASGKRDGKPVYLGLVKVISVEPDKAVCEVVDPSKLGDIEVLDNVTTDI